MTRTHSQNDFSCRSPHSRHLKGPVQTMNCGHFLVQALYVEQMSALSFVCLETTLLSMSFGKKSGWSAVTTEPLTDPQPMSQSPAPIGHFPPTLHVARSLGQLAKRGALSTVLDEPNPTTSFPHSHTCFVFCFFYLRLVSISVTCFIHDLCCRLICFFLCMFEVVEKAIIHTYSTACPHSPSSPQCCLALSLAQDQTHDLYSKPDSSKTSS